MLSSYKIPIGIIYITLCYTHLMIYMDIFHSIDFRYINSYSHFMSHTLLASLLIKILFIEHNVHIEYI